MSTPESNSTIEAKTAPGEIPVEREIRFAVVMYGGVSLAIYINGVTQELLRMVRATARAATPATMLLSPEQLAASEKVYRKIAELLDKEIGGGRPPNNLTQTRFIVDVISGTSAGGINGVFLAKALARNQTMDGLKKLWLTEGDLGKLLNDTKAEDYAPELGFAVQRPEKSLLNSQRMYRKLLEALEQMGTSTSAESAPLVNELDLFVTTTDIEGVPLPIRLADKIVYERRHRNVFHFRCEPRPTDARKQKLRRDDFIKEYDPFLAFAARCTSSFPFAFDAMQLGDIKTILERYHLYEDDDPTESNDPERNERWDKFFKDYIRLGLIDISRKARGEKITEQSVAVPESTKDLRKAFRDRSFGDGGYLDNKPFSYATSMLMRRQANCVVDRKLIYVEPTPEHPELAPRRPGPRPDFAQNVRAAVLDLPRQETIREDIERIYERNSIVERVGSFARFIDEDAMTLNFPAILHRSDYAAKDLKAMIQHGYGACYGAYHRLKVREVTELLTCLVTRALGHDPASDAGDAIRELVTLWRNDKYKLLKPLETRKHGEGNQETENQFLLDYDVHYRLRRLSFLSRRINELAGIGPNGQLDQTARSLLLAWLRRATKPRDEARSSEEENISPPSPEDLNRLTAVKVWLEANETTGRPLEPTEQIPSPDEWVTDFRRELSAVKKQIDDPIQDARFTEEQFLDPNSDASQRLEKQIAQLKLPWKDVEPLLSNNPAERKKAIDKLIGNGVMTQLDLVADEICAIFDNANSSGLVIATANDTDPRKGAQAARMCLKHYYQNFLVYDLITYPIQYGTGAGEANIVQVYRISPEDALAIMQEKAGAPRDKLAGRELMSFGAFLDESWRKNDMLWGRLDGAERLITILLGHRIDNGECAAFVREAHIEILREEISQGNGDAVCRLLGNALAHSAGSSNQHLEEIVNEVLKKPDLAPYLTDARRDYLVAPEKFNRQLDAEIALKYIARSTTITGNMLDGLADQHRLDQGKRMAGWVTRFGATFWNMIAVAVPQSLGNLFFRHWLGLLYLFSAVVILAGIAFKSVSSLGWQLLGATVSLHVLTLFLADFIAGKFLWIRAARRFGVLLVAILIGFGTYFVSDRSLKFLAAGSGASITGVIAGFAVLLLLGFVEWRRWLKSFLRAPTTTFSYRLLGGLTAATFVLAFALVLIGPVDMRGFEFSRTTTIADSLTGHIDVDRMRVQLGVDFALIVAYASMLAGYCVAGAKLFWRRRENLAYKLEQNRQTAVAKAKRDCKTNSNSQSESQTKSSLLERFWLAFLLGAVVTGFALAGLQWIAAIADASENVGLLLYLRETPPPDFSGLELAYWSASLKFWLIALGAAYSVVALLIGAWKESGARPAPTKPHQVFLRIIFALVSVVYLALSVHALSVCRPNPKGCSPELLSEVMLRLLH